MIRSNKDFLPQQSVQGKIHHPTQDSNWRAGRDGIPRLEHGVGGIVYNAKIGDNCMHWVSDHLEPGVSIKNDDTTENGSLNMLSCVGNEAVVVSGEAKGAIGFVTGKHGGIDHVITYFSSEVLEKMAVDDKILIKAQGQGLKLMEYSEIVCANLDPHLLDKLGLKKQNDILEIPVAFEIPYVLMGSGIGSGTTFSGDFDIATGDPDSNSRLNLDQLRFGDIVLLRDCYSNYGREYLQGAVTIGVVIHGDSRVMGHGPGVTTLMSSRTNIFKPVISKKANLADILADKL